MTRSRSPAWIALWALLISSLYLPTLGARFDFNDDGNLVYRSAPAAAAEHLRAYWSSVLGEYHNLGLFRPVLLAHWEVEAQLLGPNALRWRLARLLWAALAAAAMLTLMLELRIRPPAAIAATAVAMWAPEQSEVWHALTLSEGVAMPYALMGLICAVRAARSSHPLKWDVGGALFVLAALGCKNTFAAIVPAQMMLRIAPDARDLRPAWHHRGRRALLLASTLLLPLGHFALYKTGWHAGQYVTGAPLPGQLSAMIRGISKEAAFLLLPLALSVIALLAWGFAQVPAAGSQPRTRLISAAAEGLGPLLREYRGACAAGLLLLSAGIAVYLPVRLHNPGGRYSIPAAWGGDLWFAALLSTLFEAPVARFWKRAAYGALALAIGGLGLANLAYQSKFAARAQCLWQALELVEQRAAPDSCIGWLYGPGLARGEGIHFAWHLRARGNALRMALIDTGDSRLDPDNRLRDLGDVAPCNHPNILVSGGPTPPAGFSASPTGVAEARYWFGVRRFKCFVWRKRSAVGRTSLPAIPSSRSWLKLNGGQGRPPYRGDG